MKRISLATGVELDVAIAGDPANPAMIFLHGFPESHRTWRHQIAEFSRDYLVVAPDQRGYAGSSKPEGVESYKASLIVQDLVALVDQLGIGNFTLVGHDWGGAVAWLAALQLPRRVDKLIILNAPHPLIFQRTLIDDAAQRQASQYMNLFRNPGFDSYVENLGLPGFFDTIFAKHADPELLGPEKEKYLAEWSQPGALTAMVNWYRASDILVPQPGETPARPAWIDGPFPPVTQPTLVIWGMGDVALLPVQLEGLRDQVADLEIVQIADSGHFVSWEKPEQVNAAIRNWLNQRQQ